MIEWVNSLSKFGITALSVCSSLLIAFLAGYLRAKIAHKDRTYERNIFLRNKYERLGIEASKLLGFCESLLNSTKEQAILETPGQSKFINKMRIYSLIYFPNLKNEVNNLVVESIDFVHVILKESNLASDISIGVQTLKNQPSLAQTQKMGKAKKEFLEAYEKNAVHYTFTSDVE